MPNVGIQITGSDNTGGAFSSVSQKLGGLKNEASGLGDTIGGVMDKFAAIGVVITAVANTFGQIKQAIDTADEFSKLSQKTGIATEALRQLNYAASLSDVSTESLATGLKKLSVNMAGAASGSKEQVAAFAAVGVSVKGLDGKLKGADTMMSELAGKFASFKDSPEKAALAIALFGKAGADMIPLLNSGADGLEAMANEATALGTVFTGDMAKSAEAFNDNLTRMQTLSKGSAYTIAAELLPTLNILSESFLDAQKTGGGFASVLGLALKTTLETVSVLAANVAFLFGGLGREIGANAAKINALAHGDLKGFRAISEAVKEDGVRAAAELDKFENRLLNLSKANLNIGSAYNARQGFGEVLKTTAPVIDGAEAAAAAAARAAALAAMNKELEAQKKILSELSGLTGSFAEDWGRLGAMYKKGSINLEQLTTLQEILLGKQPAIKAAMDAEAKSLDQQSKAYEANYQSRAKYLDTTVDQAKKLEKENASFGLSAEALAALTSQRELDQAATLQGIAIKQLDRDNDIESYNATMRLVGAMRQQAANTLAKPAMDAAKELEKANLSAAKESEKYWEDALMRAFESGKGFFESLWDTIKNTLKTQVLKVTLQGVMGTLGIGAAGAANAGGGMLSSMGTSIAGTGIGNSLSLATVGSAFSGAFSAGASIGIDAFSAGATMMAEASGVSSFMAGAGQMLGAIGPAGWAALAVGAIISMRPNFISATDSGRARIDYSSSGVGGAAYSTTGSQAQIDAQIANTNALAKSYFDTAKSLGITALKAAFEIGTNTGREGAAPQTVLGVNIGSKSYSSGEISSADAAGLQQASLRAIMTALQASELPKYLAGVFDDITATTATTDQITASLAGAQALATFHTALQSLPFDSLKDLTYTATQSLIGFSGSLENLQTNLGGFYTNFYTSAEKTAQLTTNTATAFSKLGITMPAISESTRDWYKELVLSQMALDQSVPANAAATAGVLSLQGAVNELAPAFVDAAAAAAQALQKIRTAVDSAVALQVQLGTRTELSVVQDTAMKAWAALQAAIPGSGRFTEADIAAYAANPLNQSTKTNDVGLTQAQIDAMNTFVTASSTYHSYIDSHAAAPKEPTAVAVAVDPNIARNIDIRLGFERQLLELNKDTAHLRLLDIARMDAYNVGLYDQIVLLKDTQAANAAAAEKTRATANERKGLQDQLNGLTDTNAQALARQRDALDESNRALFDNIQAIKAVQAAYASSKTGTDAALGGVKASVEKEKARIQGLIDAASSGSDSAKKASDDALAALNRAIDAEKTRIGIIRDAASESVNAIKGVFDLLKDQVKQLYAETDATLGMQADQGNAFIVQALQTALSTGYMPDQAQLADAIAGARGGLDKNNYATAFEYDKATLTLAGKLSQLRDIAGPQLTSAQSALKAAEDQLKALDAQAALAKTQIDTLRGIDTSVLSVSDAVAALQTRMASEASTAAASGAVDTQALKDQLTALDATLDLAQKQYDAINGIDSSVKSVADAVNALAAAMGKQASSGAANLYASNASAIAKPDATGLQYWGDQITANGYDATKPIFDATVTSINDTVKGWYANNPDATKTPDAAGIQYWLQQIADTGEMSAKQNFANVVASITNKPVRPISSFKVGTNYTQEGLAYLHEGEAVVPRAYNPAAGGSGNTERLERLVEGLTAEVQRLQAVVATGNRHAERTATVLDDAARGKQPLSTAA